MTFTVTAIQLVWIIAGLLEVVNTAWWSYVTKRDSRYSGNWGDAWNGFMEGIAWLVCTLLILIAALVATVVLR